jgi:4-amino-4-deoxy-L-arabinose transferase-like glycosyltransferase
MSLKARWQSQGWILNAAVVSVLVSAAYYFVAFIYIAASRIRYPFSLEWLEGASFLQVHRILSGQWLYARPSYEYVAVIYPPFYYYVAAIVSRLIGLSFLPLRLVSLASSLGCIGLIYMICRRERVGGLPAVMASALFAATYQATGTWFDIGRVDMLSVFLVLLTIYLLRYKALWSYLVAGFAITLACLTKQTHLLTLGVLILYFVLFERGQSLAFVLSALVSLTVAYLILDRIYSGWMGFYTLKLALGSTEFVSMTSSPLLTIAGGFWWNAILGVLPVAVLLIIAYAITNLVDRHDLKRFYFYLFCAAGMIGTSWAVIHVGGYKNDLVPAYAILAILFGFSVQQVCFERGLKPTYQAALLAACVLQFVILYYPISTDIPTKADLQAGRALIGEIAQQPGPVYIPFHPELSLMAAKPAFANWSAIYQLEGDFGGGDAEETRRVKAEFTNAMAKHEFSMIILDKDLNWVWGHPEKYYTLSTEPVFSSPDVFWPVTGWAVRPSLRMFPTPQ